MAHLLHTPKLRAFLNPAWAPVGGLGLLRGTSLLHLPNLKRSAEGSKWGHPTPHADKVVRRQMEDGRLEAIATQTGTRSLPQVLPVRSLMLFEFPPFRGIAHKKTPTPLGPPKAPRHRPTVWPWGRGGVLMSEVTL